MNGIYLLGWYQDYPHISNYLDFHFNANNPQFGHPVPEIFEPLEAASQYGDINDALDLYAQVNNAIKEYVPMIPIVHSATVTIGSKSIQGLNHPFGSHPKFKLISSQKEQIFYVQIDEPNSLFCPDETNNQAFAVCQQVLEGLYQYDIDGSAIPALATDCTQSPDLRTWTCSLREGVHFHDGSLFDANDVVASFGAGIDASNPYHVGNSQGFEIYNYLWGGLMNDD